MEYGLSIGIIQICCKFLIHTCRAENKIKFNMHITRRKTKYEKNIEKI